MTYQMLSANKSLSNTDLLKAADAAAEFLYQKGRNLCGDQKLNFVTVSDLKSFAFMSKNALECLLFYIVNSSVVSRREWAHQLHMQGKYPSACD